jgi:hypothetical protein
MEQMELDENEVLKNQLVGWGVTLAAALLGLSAGAGVFSGLIGLAAAIVVMTWRIKRNEERGVAR